MRTTVEISDELFKRSRQLANSEGVSLRALIEEGLRWVIKKRQARQAKGFAFPTFGRDGISDELRGADWNEIRDTIYRNDKR